MIVKGISQNMPPLLTSSEIVGKSESSFDSLGDRFHRSLTISPGRSSQTTSTSHSSGASFSSQGFSTSSSRPSTSTSQVDASPIIYAHVRNLRGIISSNYQPTSTSGIRELAHPLGNLAARYLSSHGYGTEDVGYILQVYTDAEDTNQFITSLARKGMSVNEAKFLLLLIKLHDPVLRN